MTAPALARGHATEPDLLAGLVAEVARAVLGPVRTRSVVIAMSRDENPKATVLVRADSGSAPSLAIKVGTTAAASAAVMREAAALRGLEQADPGRVHGTVPRCLEVRRSGEHAVLVTSVCAGVPLSTTYHRWRHTATADRVRADFTAVAAWLAELGRVSGEGGHPGDLGDPGDPATTATAVATLPGRTGSAAGGPATRSPSGSPSTWRTGGTGSAPSVPALPRGSCTATSGAGTCSTSTGP